MFSSPNQTPDDGPTGTELYGETKIYLSTQFFILGCPKLSPLRMSQTYLSWSNVRWIVNGVPTDKVCSSET